MDVSKLPANIQTEAVQLRTKLYDCIEEEDWKLLKHHKKEELKVFSKHSREFNGKMFKGVCVVYASPESCFQQFKSKEKWDSSIKTIEMVDTIRVGGYPEAYIQRTVIHSCLMGLVSGRDFVDLVVTFNDDKGVGTMAQTSPTELCPPCKEHVRGTNHYCGILATRVPNNPNQTEIIYVAHTDLGGNLPLSLVEKAIPPAIHSFCTGLKSQLKKAGQLTKPDSEKFIILD